MGGCAAWRFGEGPLVLLVHGWAGRGLQWNALIDPLVDAGCSVLAIDLPAHGETPGKEATFIWAGEAIKRIINEKNPAAIVAHSFGAGATTYAVQGTSMPVVFAGGPAETMPIVDRFCAFVGVGPKTKRLFIEKALQKTNRTEEDVHVGSMAARCKGPALCLQDPEDNEVPFAETAHIMAGWPGATHRALPGVGHYRILWRQESIDAIMAFMYSTGVAQA